MKLKILIILTFTLAFIPASATRIMASQYSPEGLYDPEYFTLDNGMGVVLKQRDVTHNVAIRLVVDVGMLDFPCGAQELPHFLEHLLFTGTSKHTEAELEALIREHGGSWNAYTMAEKTSYDIDIYSPNLLLALDLLFEIITDSQISPQNVELTREIIHRESGGKPSWLRRWLYRIGIGRTAATNAFLELFPDSGLVCPNLETAEGISRDDIVQAYRQYYVPNNMTLIVAGEFERAALIGRIEKSFGTLEASSLPAGGRSLADTFAAGPSEFSGTFSPFLDSDADVGIAVRTDGLLSPDYYTLAVIKNYLDTRLYEKLRIERGLAYSPRADRTEFARYGEFDVSADVNLKDMETALSLLRGELHALRTGNFHSEDIEKAKQRILLSWVQGYETNSGIADYYAASLFELKEYGALVNVEDRIEQVSEADVRASGARYFRDERLALLKSRPVLTYTQCYLIMGIFFVAAVLLVWRVTARINRRLQRGRPPHQRA